MTKGKNGQKFGKNGATFSSGQKNSYPSQGRGKGGQNVQKKGSFADKRPSGKGLRQTERFDPVSLGYSPIQLLYLMQDYKIFTLL